MPSLRITIAAGQKPVNADWSRLAPMNAVNQKKLGCTNWVNSTLMSTITPANACTARSRVMGTTKGSAADCRSDNLAISNIRVN